MNEEKQGLDSVRRAVQSAIPPYPEPELKHDLWPGTLLRLERSSLRFGYLEALLASLIVLALAIFPELIPILLYHF